MKKIITLLLFSLLTSSTFAAQYSPTGTKQIGGQASIRHNLQSTLKDSINSSSFLSSEKISLSFKINIAQEDIGLTSNLYLLARYNDQMYIKNAFGKWALIENFDSLASFAQKKLQATEEISVVTKANLGAGEYLVYVGYKSRSGTIKYNESAASFAVFADNSPALHSVKNKDFLISFLNKASNVSYGQPHFSTTSGGDISGGSSSSSSSGASPSNSSSSSSGGSTSSSSLSQTNLQEQGVDEGDKIKTWENTLFTLGYCETSEQICSLNPFLQTTSCVIEKHECLSSYTMQETPAASIKLDQILFENSPVNELYLHNNNSGQTAIVLATEYSYPIWSIWSSPYYWQGGKVTLSLLDVSQPEAMQLNRKITLDGSKIASRMVGDTLYLLTRNNPDYTYTPPIALPSTDSTFFFREPEREQLTENQLIPRIQFDNGDPIALVDATNCYLPVTKSSQTYDQSLITLTAIPINDPKNFKSICISGAIETFYMSSESIYLASSRVNYQQQGNAIVYDLLLDYTTDIHKFSFKGSELSYRGSGQVAGHLGWEQDKRSFRFGENKGILKVATSIGNTWGNNSSTRVGVFKEDPETKTLLEISHLDNLGKPGEKLYAARFIEDRGFLVTFRVTDPLYVLDFSDPYKPQISGELEIDGYSDYLHPVGKNYLLGLGKDAIADQNADRGAWYQGVKLSLFDISEPGNLKEVQSVIIGKRGTYSNALYNHHAFTWLDRGNGQATLALPIDLHETPYEYSNYENWPWAHYQSTNTGLYVFDINTNTDPGISIMGKLINNDEAYIGNDRSVIQGDSIHYIHDNKVNSSTINSLY